MTPEGRVKAKVKRALKRYGSDAYAFWPVQSGYGEKTLDCLLCFRGHFIAIETKAPGKKPTPLQTFNIARIRTAGGYALVVDGSTDELENLLENLAHDKGSTGKPQAQDAGRRRNPRGAEPIPAGEDRYHQWDPCYPDIPRTS